jgi:hypothetical protein
MGCLEGSDVPVLYVGRTVLKVNITFWGVSGQVLPHVSAWPNVWDCCATCIYCNILQSGTCISSRAPVACCAPDPPFCTHLPGSDSCLELAAVNRNITPINIFHVACTDKMCNVLLEPTNSVGMMNVILLHSNHRHVSATHVTIFRVIRTIIETQSYCVEINATLKIMIFGWNSQIK